MHLGRSVHPVQTLKHQLDTLLEVQRAKMHAGDVSLADQSADHIDGELNPEVFHELVVVLIQCDVSSIPLDPKT
jgi:uncharacterized protein YciU (UPF0263 family)